MHVMVDLETLGNEPHNGVIIAIGAVAFNLEEELKYPTALEFEACCTSQMFYMPVEPFDQIDKYQFVIEPDTLRWWLRPSRVKLFAAMVGAKEIMPLEGAFGAFKAWLAKYTKHNTDRLWSHGSTFDCMHLSQKWPIVMKESFNDVYKFRDIRDTRTLFELYETRHNASPYPVRPREQHHHPLEDAWIQAVAVQTAWKGLIHGT